MLFVSRISIFSILFYRDVSQCAPQKFVSKSGSQAVKCWEALAFMAWCRSAGTLLFAIPLCPYPVH